MESNTLAPLSFDSQGTIKDCKVINYGTLSASAPLKVWPCYFEPILAGKLTFLIRYDDRHFEPEDKLTLVEWDNHHREDGADGRLTGREADVRVTFVQRPHRNDKVRQKNPIAFGFCVFAFEVLRSRGVTKLEE